MKKKIFLGVVLVLILVPLLLLGMTGFVPGLSTLLGTDKPRDLGIKYTAEDLRSVRTKSQIEYAVLPDSSDPKATRQFSGSRPVSAEFSAAEITATLNNRPWKLWPYKNVQIKFNTDGSGEISGVLLKDKVPDYAAAINVPVQATAFVMKYLPANPVFYVKMRASLTNNKIDIFEPQSLEIGRVPIPLGPILAFQKLNLGSQVLAADFSDMTQELSKVSDKKSLIINFINERLSSDFGSFFAKKAYFAENKLVFDGILTEKISYSP